MSSYETRAKAAADGTLMVRVPPALAGQEVRVIVETASANGIPTNGTPHGDTSSHGAVSPAPLTNGIGTGAPRPKTQEEWAAFIDSFVGSIPDFPDVERPGPDSYEKREGWD